MCVARSQEERKADTRARLLHAAADQFALHGFHGVSAEAVADAANRTTGSIYSHFGGKEGLLFSLVDERQDAAAQAIINNVSDAADLDALVRAIWQQVTDSPNNQWLLLEMELWLHGARDTTIGESLASRYAQIRVELDQAVASWASTSERIDTRPTAHGAMILSLLLGAALQHHLDDQSISEHDVIRAVHHLIEP